MFKSAKIKLTGWYLFIIMAISVSFSLVIYLGATREMEVGFRRAELRRRAEELNIPLPRRFSFQPEDLPLRLREGEFTPRYFAVEDIEEAKRKLGLNLLAINGMILVVSTLAGYFLAGKTLKPIEIALEEQKRFVADASHELRTPLTALKTSMEVVLRDKKRLPKEARNLIKDNLEEVNNLQSLSNNLLSIARYQSNGQNLVFEDINIADVIEEAYKKILPLAKEKNISINIEVENQNITANKESLEQMMLIFLDNAVKYTPKSGKVNVASKTDKKHLVLEIADTGIGIAEKDLPHIFDRFYRADVSRSKEHGGFGLGLSLTKRIIEIHKGTVSVKSTPGKGTSFTVKLPARQS